MSTCPLFHLSIRPLVHSSTRLLVHSSTRLLVNPSVCQLVNLLTRHLVNLCSMPCNRLRRLIVSIRVFSAVAHARVYSIIFFFCLFFSKKFNIMSALSAHQSLTLPQKIDSREGWFWCKKCCYVNANKLDIYSNEPPFVSVFGLFAAKCTAICRKTQCVLMLNSGWNGAKCSAFCCKTQGKMVLNAVQNGA